MTIRSRIESIGEKLNYAGLGIMINGSCRVITKLYNGTYGIGIEGQPLADLKLGDSALEPFVDIIAGISVMTLTTSALMLMRKENSISIEAKVEDEQNER